MEKSIILKVLPVSIRALTSVSLTILLIVALFNPEDEVAVRTHL